jgi:1-acyl-sn-glycerol-3-phosphate acyltransferase
MARLWQGIVSIWTWLVLAGCIVLWLPVMALLRLATARSDPGRYAVGLLFRKIAVVTAALNPLWTFRRSGTPPADPRRPYIVIANHESFADILLISHLPWEMKWLSKAGDIPEKRGEGRSAVEALRACRKVLADRVSVMIFPEGTRSATGDMLPFKDGAFRLAVDTGVPILPLALTGTGPALPKRGFLLGRSVAEVRVLEPIETQGLTTKDVPALRDEVRSRILAVRDQLRSASPEPLTTTE